MRVSEEVIPPIPSQTTETPVVAQAQESDLNWKAALTLSQGKTETHLLADRAWGRLCAHIRELCPETEWISIVSNQSQTQSHTSENITALQTWIEALIASPAWPFPKQVIMLSENDGWKFLIEKSSKIPFVTPPHCLSIIPVTDNHCRGWKIQALNSFNISRAGAA